MTPGERGWVLLAAYVAGFDAVAILKNGQTLSAAFDQNLRHPVKGPLVLVAWTVTTVHLFGRAANRAVSALRCQHR